MPNTKTQKYKIQNTMEVRRMAVLSKCRRKMRAAIVLPPLSTMSKSHEDRNNDDDDDDHDDHYDDNDDYDDENNDGDCAACTVNNVQVSSQL